MKEYLGDERDPLEEQVFMYPDQPHTMSKGDSINFRSNKTHTYHNPGKRELKLMIINYYR